MTAPAGIAQALRQAANLLDALGDGCFDGITWAGDELHLHVRDDRQLAWLNEALVMHARPGATRTTVGDTATFDVTEWTADSGLRVAVYGPDRPIEAAS